VQVLDVPLERFIPELDARIEALAAPFALAHRSSLVTIRGATHHVG